MSDVKTRLKYLHCTFTDFALFSACELQPCLNGGDCVPKDDIYECSCISGYYGANCQLVNICIVQNPCQHNGECVSLGHETYECTCKAGYFGTECHLTDPCIPNPCENSGSCDRLSSTSTVYQCECATGYYGSRCQYVNPCEQDGCQNGASCLLMGDGLVECVCDQGFYGPNCQYENGCQPSPCQNGGECRNTSRAGAYECRCPVGYLGTHCEWYNPCILDPCQNGGTCYNPVSESSICECPTGGYELSVL